MDNAAILDSIMDDYDRRVSEHPDAKPVYGWPIIYPDEPIVEWQPREDTVRIMREIRVEGHWL